MTQAPPPSDAPTPGPRSGGARPVVIGVAALVLVLLTVLAVAFFGARAGPSGQPTDAPSPPPPPLELPLAVDGLSRDPNETTSTEPVDTDIETVSGTYLRDSEPSLVVIAGRPVRDPVVMLELVQAEAVRPIEDGVCGRDPSGFDVCVVVREDVAVLGLGIAEQPVQDVLADTRAVSTALPG